MLNDFFICNQGQAQRDNTPLQLIHMNRPKVSSFFLPDCFQWLPRLPLPCDSFGLVPIEASRMKNANHPLFAGILAVLKVVAGCGIGPLTRCFQGNTTFLPNYFTICLNPA
jgi:hypothetical protein